MKEIKIKKIIFFGGDYNNSGGTERVSSLILNRLASEGYQIILISAQRGDNPYYPISPNIKIYSLFKSKTRFLFRWPLLIFRLRQILLNERPDYIVGVESMTSLFIVPANLGLPAKLLCWEHFHFNNHNGHYARKIARIIAARYCDDIVTLTQKDLICWKRSIKLKSKIHNIPNPCPFDLQEFDFSKKNENMVIAVGRLTKVKGFDRLLLAWAEISSYCPEWSLKILGDGEDRETLIAISNRLNISNSVEFISHTSDIQDYYKRASVFCLSSRYEGFPMVLLEAAAFGVPVVSFDCENGPAEILAGTGASLVIQNDVYGFSQSLLRFIKDSDLRRCVGIAQRNRIKAFAIGNIIEKWIKIFESR